MSDTTAAQPQAIAGLGPLECEVMVIMWGEVTATVARVHAEIQKRRPLAYSTVATTLVRLEKKRLLSTRQLRRRGQPLRYRVRVTRDELECSYIESQLDVLLQARPDLVLDYVRNHNLIEHASHS